MAEREYCLKRMTPDTESLGDGVHLPSQQELQQAHTNSTEIPVAEKHVFPDFEQKLQLAARVATTVVETR